MPHRAGARRHDRRDQAGQIFERQRRRSSLSDAERQGAGPEQVLSRNRSAGASASECVQAGVSSPGAVVAVRELMNAIGDPGSADVALLVCRLVLNLLCTAIVVTVYFRVYEIGRAHV